MPIFVPGQPEAEPGPVEPIKPKPPLPRHQRTGQWLTDSDGRQMLDPETGAFLIHEPDADPCCVHEPEPGEVCDYCGGDFTPLQLQLVASGINVCPCYHTTTGPANSFDYEGVQPNGSFILTQTAEDYCWWFNEEQPFHQNGYNTNDCTGEVVWEADPLLRIRVQYAYGWVVSLSGSAGWASFFVAYFTWNCWNPRVLTNANQPGCDGALGAGWGGQVTLEPY